MSSISGEEKSGHGGETVHMPAPTAWPFVLAFGITLMAAGLVTHYALSFVGIIMVIRASIGWFQDLFPVEQHENVPLRPISERARPVQPSAQTVLHLRAGEAGHRVRVPAEIHPYSSGIKGGLVGGVAMAIVAVAYGLIAHGSIWFPINLLAAAALPSMSGADLEQLKAFNATAFIVALISHGVISILVGLMFAVLLPMLPTRRAAFWSSFISPLIWTALVWATLSYVNPALNDRINWYWFVASQVAFGMTCGYIIHHSKMVETMQTWPLAARAGMEAPGIMHEKEEER